MFCQGVGCLSRCSNRVAMPPNSAHRDWACETRTRRNILRFGRAVKVSARPLIAGVFPEGSEVTVICSDDESVFTANAAQERALIESIAEVEKGESVTLAVLPIAGGRRLNTRPLQSGGRC